MNRSIFAAALALGLAAATVASAQPAGAAAAFKEACGKDFQTLCAGVQPGGDRIMACFKEHQDKLSAGCKAALAQAMSARRSETPAAH